MNPSSDGKPEPIDPETDERLLELELMRQRAALQKAGTPYKGLRAISFMFLIIVILGTLGVFYYLFASGRLEEMRSSAPHSSGSTTASPSP